MTREQKAAEILKAHRAAAKIAKARRLSPAFNAQCAAEDAPEPMNPSLQYLTGQYGLQVLFFIGLLVSRDLGVARDRHAGERCCARPLLDPLLDHLRSHNPSAPLLPPFLVIQKTIFCELRKILNSEFREIARVAGARSVKRLGFVIVPRYPPAGRRCP